MSPGAGEKRVELDAGEVLIVGGGATGLLTARLLDRRGLSWTLIESRGWGAEQSNHSHGYIHQGYAYPSGSHQLVQTLQRGSERWAGLLTENHIGPVTKWSLIGFTDHLAALAMQRRWAQLGLSVAPAEIPAWLAGGSVARVFRTDESAYDFTHVFRTLAQGLKGTTIVGTVTELQSVDARITGVKALVDGQRVLMRAGHVVLGAGVSNEALLASVTAHRGRAVSRTSYMLTASSPNLPRASLIVPEQASYGLFLVSRMDRDRVVWLISDFLSYARASQPHRIAQQLWIAGALDALSRIYDLSRDPEVELGVYAAPKMELRPRAGELSVHAAERYRHQNLVVAAPTKLTLAPLLATRVVQMVNSGEPADVPKGLPTPDAVTGVTLTPIVERWTGVPTLPWERFLSEQGLAAPLAD